MVSLVDYDRRVRLDLAWCTLVSSRELPWEDLVDGREHHTA
jgi:hypothetical protein